MSRRPRANRGQRELVAQGPGLSTMVVSQETNGGTEVLLQPFAMRRRLVALGKVPVPLLYTCVHMRSGPTAPGSS